MRWTRRRHERGAAALEFGLVSPLVFAVLFGTITYGLWLNDSMNLRSGLREASRQGVVGNFGSSTCAPTYAVSPSANIGNLVCRTKQEVSAYTGDTYVKVLVPEGWVRGKELVVCSMIDTTRLPGIVPLPNDRMIKFQSRMSIEKVLPGQVETGGEEALPPGGSWAWCAP